MAVRAVAPDAAAEGFERKGPKDPVDGDPGALSLRALVIWYKSGGGGDQVRGVAVGPLYAPGEVLERDARDHPVLLEVGSHRRGGWSSSALFTQTDVLHQDRGDDRRRDGDEGEDEAVVERIREAFAGDLKDLVYQLLPAGEGGGHAI